MRRIFVKPADGLRVYDELSRSIPPEGCNVNRTPHIVRLIKDGSLKSYAERVEKKEVTDDNSGAE